MKGCAYNVIGISGERYIVVERDTSSWWRIQAWWLVESYELEFIEGVATPVYKGMIDLQTVSLQSVRKVPEDQQERFLNSKSLR